MQERRPSPHPTPPPFLSVSVFSCVLSGQLIPSAVPITPSSIDLGQLWSIEPEYYILIRRWMTGSSSSLYTAPEFILKWLQVLFLFFFWEDIDSLVYIFNSDIFYSGVILLALTSWLKVRPLCSPNIFLAWLVIISIGWAFEIQGEA